MPVQVGGGQHGAFGVHGARGADTEAEDRTGGRGCQFLRELAGCGEGIGTDGAVEVPDAAEHRLAAQREDRAAQLVGSSEVEGEDVAG